MFFGGKEMSCIRMISEDDYGNQINIKGDDFFNYKDGLL